MVPGMLYSRFRPGLNHLAFRVDGDVSLAELVAAASDHGWAPMPTDSAHPIAGGADVAYLEDRDGFEVELVS
jgi:catechol 2,3-dioxygenase-like lactoylglutathione lyase family enzyme